MSRTKNQDITPFLQSLPQTLREPIEKLRDVQKQCDSIKVQYLKELKALEAKYKTFYDPVYDTRARIIRGVATTGFQSVPGFWLRVFLSSSPVGRTITKKDEEILRYLMDVRSSPLPNERSGFELMFQFAQNPYFTDSQLTKSYVLGDEEDGMLESSSGCQIHWNEGKNPKLKTIWRNGRQAITETESFFDFFQPLPMGDVSEDLNFEQIHLVQESLEEDFEIGLVIKDSLIPNAVSWFTGELAEISSSSEDNDDDSSECSSNDQINTEEEE
eukprot:g8668.t1